MISYENIACAVLSFLAGLVLHIGWWRMRRPKDDVLALVLCVVLIPCAADLVWAFSAWGSTSGGAVLSNSLVIALLSSVLGGAYITAYPGAEAGSPSMLILLKVAERRGSGISPTELMACFDETVLCDGTLATLVNQRFALAVNGRLVPGPRGARMVRVCQIWRAVLGLPDGEG
jgi:hypothetical protein